MGPLQPNRDDLIAQLSAAPSASGGTVPPAVQHASDKSPSAALGVASLLWNIGSWFGSNLWNDARVQRQNAQNLSQWQRETAYNSPLAQVQRLKAAGINPALAFANGDVQNEAAASPMMAHEPITSPVEIDPLTAAQINQLNADAEERRSNIPVNQQRANEIRQNARILENQGNFAAATYLNKVAEYMNSSNVSIAKAQEELKYARQNVKNDADRLEAIAQKAVNDKLISDEEYKQAQDISRRMKAEADIAEAEKDKAAFWSALYQDGIKLYNTTHDFLKWILHLSGIGNYGNGFPGELKEDIRYFLN